MLVLSLDFCLSVTAIMTYSVLRLFCLFSSLNRFAHKKTGIALGERVLGAITKYVTQLLAF